MEIMTYTEARSKFAETMDRVCDDHTPIAITRQNKRPVVVMSLEDYNALEETLYLLRSPKNAQRLLKAVQDVEEGKNLIEVDIDPYLAENEDNDAK